MATVTRPRLSPGMGQAAARGPQFTASLPRGAQPVVLRVLLPSVVPAEASQGTGAGSGSPLRAGGSDTNGSGSFWGGVTPPSSLPAAWCHHPCLQHRSHLPCPWRLSTVLPAAWLHHPCPQHRSHLPCPQHRSITLPAAWLHHTLPAAWLHPCLQHPSTPRTPSPTPGCPSPTLQPRHRPTASPHRDPDL